MKKNYKKNPAVKLAAYSAMAGAFIAIGSEAKAQVVYNDIPDEFLEIGDLFELDMDGDTQGDLLFQVATAGASWSFDRVFGYISTSVYAMGDPSNNVIGYSGAFLPYGSALNSGDNIGPGEGFLSAYNVVFLASIYGGVTYGQWPGATDQYLGVKFIIGGDTHYGWVRMDATVGPVTLTIKDYAYEASDATAIAAGDVGGGGGITCDTPSPSVLVVSSSGAKIGWDAVEGAGNYKIRYRVAGTETWQKEHTPKLKQRLTELVCATTYEYQVAAVCTDGVDIAESSYSEIATFTTDACRIGAFDGEGDIALNIAPNPAQQFINLYTDGFETETVTVEIYNVLGEKITGMEVALEEEMQMDVSDFQIGVYTVVISDGSQSVANQFVKQ